MGDPKEQELLGHTQAGGSVLAEPDGKKWYASKTLQACVAVAGGAAVDALAGGLNWRQAVLMGIAALFAVLRKFTSEPLAK